MTIKCKDPQLLAAIEVALNRLAKGNDPAYDGVRGDPPDVGDVLTADFREARNRMLYDGHSVEDIRRWMDAYRAPPVSVDGRMKMGYWPAEYENEIRTLVCVDQMVRDGREGMRRFLGDEAYQRIGADVVSEIASNNASGPRKPRVLSLQLDALTRVVAQHPGITAGPLRAMLEHEPLVYEDEVADDLELRLDGSDVIVTNLTTGLSNRISQKNQNDYLRRAKRQLTR